MSALYGMVQLEFPQDRFIGRDEEMVQLQELFRKGLNKCHIVMLKGNKGTGKTLLLQKFTRDFLPQRVFASHVLCSSTLKIPTRKYGAIFDAMTALCQSMLDADDMMLTLCSNMDDMLIGEPRQVMLQYIPKIGELLGESAMPISQDYVDQQFFDALVEGIHCFFTVICNTSSRYPVFLSFEDFHTIDHGSLQLLQILLDTSQSLNLFILGAYRPDELLDQHQHQHQQNDKTNIPAINSFLSRAIILDVNPFDLPTTTAYIARSLERERTLVSELAQVVHEKTEGTIFYVQEFLKMLQKKFLLKFELGACQWKWEQPNRIVSETNVCQNVAKKLIHKLEDLSETEQIVIKHAACLGPRFEVELLHKVLEQVISPAQINEALESFVNKRIMEQADSLLVKFAHPSIHQRAYDKFLQDQNGRAELHNRVGQLLWDKLTIIDHEQFLEVTNHFNKATSCIQAKDKRLELARMNLEAGKAAISMSAFIPASKYFQSGLTLLEESTCWKDHYNLTLQLATSSAEAEYYSGNFSESTMRARSVLSNGQTIQDRIPAHITMVQSLGAQTRFVEALKQGLQVLACLGERFPTQVGPPRLLAEWMRIKRLLRKYTDEQLLDLPLLTDSNKAAAMKIVNELSMSALCTSKGDWLPFLALRMIGMTLEYGIRKESACAFVTYGALLCGPLGDMEEGMRFGKLALRMLSKFEAKDLESRVHFWIYSSINHWRRPLTECHDPLLQSYRTGMQFGDIHYALQSATLYCVMYLYSGLPLEPIESDMVSYCTEMKNYQQKTALVFCRTTHQFVHCLMGKTKDPMILSGEVMDHTQALNEAIKCDYKLAIAHIRLMRLILAYYFGDLKLAEELSRHQRRASVYQSLYETIINEFFIGLIACALARKLKKRKYHIQARKAIAKLKKWSKSTGNCQHILTLLQAELFSISSKKQSEEVKRYYDLAIAMAGRIGFLHDKALATEKAGLFFFRQGDDDWASHYLTISHRLYGEWGAKAKCISMEKQFSSLLTPPDALPSTINHRGRRRFSGRSSSTHRRISVSSYRRDSISSYSSSTARRISTSTFSSLRSSGTGKSQPLSSAGSSAGWGRRLSEGNEEDVSDSEELQRSVPPSLILKTHQEPLGPLPSHFWVGVSP